MRWFVLMRIFVLDLDHIVWWCFDHSRFGWHSVGGDRWLACARSLAFCRRWDTGGLGGFGYFDAANGVLLLLVDDFGFVQIRRVLRFGLLLCLFFRDDCSFP